MRRANCYVSIVATTAGGNAGRIPTCLDGGMRRLCVRAHFSAWRIVDIHGDRL